jgi:uncharacterized protein
MTEDPAAGLAALISRARGQERGLPPVERWNPPFCGNIDMEIRRDGTWFYCGTPIGRPAMVELFASVLRKDEDGKTYLVTPVEKVGIRVEDAPFTIVEIDVAGEGDEQRITARSNVGDVVEAGADHALRFDIEPQHGGLKPYLHVRGRLEGLFTRAATHALVAAGEEMVIAGRPMFAIRSGGAVFPVMAVDELARMVAA